MDDDGHLPCFRASVLERRAELLDPSLEVEAVLSFKTNLSVIVVLVAVLGKIYSALAQSQPPSVPKTRAAAAKRLGEIHRIDADGNLVQ